MISKTYDRVKTVALVVLPLLATLYVGAAEIWHLPYAVQIAGTLALIDTFLGALVKRLSTVHQEQVSTAPVVADMKLLTDLDGVPTGAFRIRDDAFNGITFKDKQLVSFRIKKEVKRL